MQSKRKLLRLGIEVPSDLGRASLSKLMADAHGEEGIEVVETVSFLGPHSCSIKRHAAFERAGSQKLCNHRIVVNSTLAGLLAVDRVHLFLGRCVIQLCVVWVSLTGFMYINPTITRSRG